MRRVLVLLAFSIVAASALPALGGEVTIEIHQTLPGQVLTAEIRELRERHTGSVLQIRTLDPSEELTRAISFDGISPGTYAVHAKGREGSQVAGVEVVVAEIPSAPAHLQILPFTLRVRTGIHGDSKVVLANREGRWETESVLDADGAVDLPLWQGGRLNARVFARGHIPFRVSRTVESADTEWLIEMPERRVTGTVVDGDTGAPISGVPFEILERLHGRGSRMVSGADGIITLHAMPPGLYELRPIRTPPAMKAPLRFQAVPGENRATMTFAAASRS